jgi:hypothetical protein
LSGVIAPSPNHVASAEALMRLLSFETMRDQSAAARSSVQTTILQQFSVKEKR